MADLPQGEETPSTGELPNPDISDGFSAYVHIPFCAVRCGYCDFNTYTVGFGEGARTKDYHESVMREIALSRRILGADFHVCDEENQSEKGGENVCASAEPGNIRQEGGKGKVNTPVESLGKEESGYKPLLNTVFFGGGTPTLLNAGQLGEILAELRSSFGLRPGAEITSEANPESLTRESVEALAAAGFTRISFGMQSAVRHVLNTLDRKHTPGQVNKAVAWAKEAGINVSLDLIYGAPGESMEDWQRSVETAIALEPDHISAYALTVEPGTKMGAQAARGQIKLQDPDFLAEKYECADEFFERAGYGWYEISNWARPGKECRHNAVYWGNGNWWGYGPGAHSHINGTRFWNVKHPRAYATRVTAGLSPAAGREVLGAHEIAEEKVMLGIRMLEGIPVPEGVEAHVIARLISDGLIDPGKAMQGRLVLSRKGRLLADAVTRELWG